jgi:AAA+ ATPase superfamily predicted ATPase
MSSIVQRWWDEHWSRQNLLVILCGSLVSLMHRETLARSSPLYGRRTGQWLLDPLSFSDVAPFFPGRTAEELVRFWALAGGVPHYAALAAPFRRSRDALRELVLKKDGPLYAEARFLLQDEVRVPGVYWSLLQTIGSGVSRISEIAGRMGLKANQLTRYLAAIQDSRLVAREVPATEENPSKSKRGIYEVADPFLRLWFGLVSHVVSYLEIGRIDEAERWLEERLAGHWSWAFERICRQYVEGRARELGIVRVGRYWDSGRELDIVGIGERGRVVFAGECKWTASPLGMSHLEMLKAKIQGLWPEAASSLRLALFSRSGFSPALKAGARADGVLLVDPRALYRRA